MIAQKSHARYKGEKLKGPRRIVEKGARGYPDALTLITEPPERLYIVGNVDALQEGLAVVGARKATPYGLSCARRFATKAAQQGIVIISGGARGCDAAAHRAALDAKAPTVVFLGGGCDELYPAQHFTLFQEIVDAGGAVVSENPWGFVPLPYTFRARNRLIAGLARATLIVEAGLPSGTFSTADEALAANRDVLVVPGAITSSSSRGANRLLYQGATPIVDDESFYDVISSIFSLAYQPRAGHADDRAPCSISDDTSLGVILQALTAEALGMDELYAVIASRTKEADVFSMLMAALVEGERRGEIVRYPDGRYGPVLKE